MSESVLEPVLEPVFNRLLLIVSLLACSPSWALNGGVVEAGHGNGIDRQHIGVISSMDKRWQPLNGWHIAGHWETGIGHLRGRGNGQKSSVEVSLTPVLRFRPDGAASTQPYLEGGIGVHLLTQDRLDDQHDLGAHALLAELIGMGVTFGDRSQYDLGYRLHNLGNPGSKNAPIHSVRLIYAY